MNKEKPFIDPIVTLSIELLPEFGFTVQDEPMYGPGSVFQGIVHLRMKESPLAADKLILTFRGAEYASTIHDGHKFLVPLTKNPFFGMQQTLWRRTRDDCLLTESHYQFPFTIQMPMIQFPPSMEHILYQCKFHLSAKLVRTTFTLPTVMTQQTIRYRPFIETSLLKQPIIEEGYDHGLFASVRLHSLDYVPSDSVPVTIITSRRHLKTKEEEPATRIKSILLELCETVSLVSYQAASITRVCASKLFKPSSSSSTTADAYSLVKTQHGNGAEYKMTLTLPPDLIPSINYSKIVHVAYTLRIKIKSSRYHRYYCSNNTTTSLLLEPFHLLQQQPTVLMEIPLKIGTLGYGIRASQDLKLYYHNDDNTAATATATAAATATALTEESPEGSSIPRFLRSIEYEDALPLYDSTKLPSYVASTTA
ncbi:uncharacterized protein BX663DRAFT_485126 [Cokeromyces recurvatus]|uniref:uncharacterized protein n=1 Tax=Cokeromyces recurvatus TaxID=90255 RepID=UPI00221F40D9|nr:uncharacterized protein BX663DRAFT_485126 [Cokeromyces recurvatus]KAI7904300.1 hypothetical protein BX663DRAFT_485126 [Cokeromyces recurvatus]